MILREPKSVVVTPPDLWAIQRALPFNSFMLDPRTGAPIFPMSPRKYGGGEVVLMHTTWKLRDKVNRLLLRMADEQVGELLLPLDYDECWYIDSILAFDSYQGDVADDTGLRGSKRLLIGVFRCIYEHEQMVTLAEGIRGADVDGDFNVAHLSEYLQQAEIKGGWRLKGPGPGTGTGPEGAPR